jgi:5-formyltetrahydrofolate cyclo-ligase
VKKIELRRSLLQYRQTLTSEDWQQKSRQLCQHLQTSAQFTQSQTVLAYFSVRQEPDLSPLLVNGQRWGFPRCVGKTLHWHSWSPEDAFPLQSGAFGIREPHADAPTLNPDDVDLILVPAVACDSQGYRLGYGGGFYDRMLSSPVWANKPTIGIVFEFARLTQLPIDPWDRPLHSVCTEIGMFSASE